MTRKLCLLSLVAAFALGLAPGSAFATYDNLNDQTLGNVPYTSAAIFDASTPPFNNSAFTVDDAEKTHAISLIVCDSDWMSKTAWVHFRTGVAGKVNVQVDSNFDTAYYFFATPALPGQTSFVDLSGKSINCKSENNGGGETFDIGDGWDVPANRTIYVVAGSICAHNESGFPDSTYAGHCSTAEEAAAPDGNLSFRLRFKPNNGDGDAKPDTVDNCPANSNSGQQDQDHDGKGDVCDSDRDGDGRANSSDNCSIVPNPTQANQDSDGFGDVCDPDLDGDGDPNTSDCDSDNPIVGHGLPEEPGKDQNCNGSKRKFPRVSNAVKAHYLYLGRTVRGYSRFTVHSVTKGMKVIVECSGRGCPFAETPPYRVKRKRARFNVGKKFNHRKLAIGTRVTIKVFRRGVKGYPKVPWIGEAVRYTIRRGGRPRRRTGCMNHGTDHPIRFKHSKRSKCR